MRVHNIYADADGETHFRDIEIAWAHEGLGGRMSERLPATGLVFRETGGDYALDWHNAPRRQYIVNLDAAVEITVSDGEIRVIGPGEVILAEDVAGKGHLSRAVSGQIRRSLFIPVD